MKKTVNMKVLDTGIVITVSTTDELFTVFCRLYTWMNISINGDIYSYNSRKPVHYTRSYFNKYFA